FKLTALVKVVSFVLYAVANLQKIWQKRPLVVVATAKNKPLKAPRFPVWGFFAEIGTALTYQSWFIRLFLYLEIMTWQL
ncbi:hypothetical protein, partial [Mannheimia haemolytica]|uniref:hypothetical protein n=1 Tax=Mannheimia haemolytica TaxID=75985 RepID=UPI001ED8DA2F